jgi:glycosyltransferase involved in cell wall biosynthesis
MPLFSIIIPTYDRPEFLKQAVESVLNQTIEDFECLIIDDAGSIQAESPSDSRFKVIRHVKNSGEPAARNTGLRNAQGRYVTFLDDDDFYTKERLEIALEGFHRAPVSICWRGNLDGSPSSKRSLDGNVSEIILNSMTPQMGQVAIVRELAENFDERFQALTDVEWCLRTSKKLTVATVQRVGLKYRKHSGPRNRNGLETRVICSLLLLNVHNDYFQVRPKAAAFRWKRIGIMANMLGDHALARFALIHSIRRRFEPAILKHLILSAKQSKARVEIPTKLWEELSQQKIISFSRN